MDVEDRRRPRTWSQRLAVALPLIVVWGAGTGVMVVVAAQGPERSAQLLFDPSHVAGLPWFAGLVSNLGILAWTVAVAAAGAGTWICGLGGRASARRFLLAGALVSTLFLAEDLLQLHSSVVPDLTGLPKGVVEGISALVALRWTSQYRAEIRRTHWYLLAASIGALGCSIVVDVLIAPVPGELAQVVEDGAKLLGVLAWSTYFVHTAGSICRSVFTDALLAWPDEAYDAAFGPGAFAREAVLAEALPDVEVATDPASGIEEGEPPATVTRRNAAG
jgi:hypothetical protein